MGEEEGGGDSLCVLLHSLLAHTHAHTCTKKLNVSVRYSRIEIAIVASSVCVCVCGWACSHTDSILRGEGPGHTEARG